MESTAGVYTPLYQLSSTRSAKGDRPPTTAPSVTPCETLNQHGIGLNQWWRLIAFIMGYDGN